MLDLTEYRPHASLLADYLPWGFLVAPGVVLNKDGSFQKTVQYRGPDLDSATQPELMAVSARLNNLLKRFGSGWALFFEAVRSPAPDYPTTAQWTSNLAWLIDEERRAQFANGAQFFESRHYLTFLWQPPADRTTMLEEWMFERDQQCVSDHWREHLVSFERQVSRAVDLLSTIMPCVTVLDDAATLTYLHQSISTRKQCLNTPQTPAYLDHLLTDEPLLCGIAPMLGTHHLRVVSMQGLPNSSEPGLLDAINRLGFAYRWMTRFIAMDKLQAQKLLEKKRRHWFAKRKSALSLIKEAMIQEPTALVDSDAENKALDTDEALQEVGADAVAFGYLTTSFVVMDENSERAMQKQRAIEQLLSSYGFISIAETVNAVDAWIGSLPGQVYANIRQPLVHTLNVAHLAPLSSVWAGPTRNDHLDGPPLMQVATNGTTPFRLVPHQGDVGHMMIVGPTGSGKSVLLSLIAAQFHRYHQSQIFFFDKGASARAMILGLGGVWCDLGQANEAAFQPLRDIDQKAHLTWAQEWLLLLINGENVDPDPAQKEALWSALKSLATSPKNQRTLTGLCHLLQDETLTQSLLPFTRAGAFGALLDHREECFDIAATQGFEMDQLMATKRLVLPILSYLFQKLEKRFDGKPSLLILDEAWLFLGHPAFAARIREWLKTLRKKNVSVIFATQSLADIADSVIAPALMEACPSRIFLANVQAREQGICDLYQRFGLNDRQIEIIASAVPKQDYYFQSPAGNRLFDLQLGEIALSFCGASSKDAQKAMDQITKHTPSEPEGGASFAAQWLRHCNLPWAVEALTSFPSQEECNVT